MARTPAEEPPGPGRGVIPGLVIAVVLIVLAFGGSAFGARRTESGAEKAVARRDSATTEVTEATTSSTAPLPASPRAGPVAAGQKVQGDTPCPKADGSSPRVDLFAKVPPMCIDPSKTYTAVLATTAGKVTAKLDTTKTPATTNNFVVLSRYHYYDGSTFFRTDPRIDIIQGGNPKTQSFADPGPGYTIPLEPPVEVDPATGQPKGTYTYTPGDLVMVPGQGPESAGAGFFFVAGPNAKLLDADGIYVVFGKATQGLDVLQKVLASHVACPATDEECQGGGPDPVVTVSSITIQES